MPVKLYVTPIQATHHILKTQKIDQIISVLPRAETSITDDPLDLMRAPESGDRRHDWIEIADACYGETDLSDENIKSWTDCIIAEQMPSRSHIEKLIESLKHALSMGSEKDRNWSLLIHCHGGVSRSVAAAYILLCMLNEPGTEQNCFDKLPSTVGQTCVTPNPLVISIADDILGRNGRMKKAVITELSKPYGGTP